MIDGAARAVIEYMLNYQIYSIILSSQTRHYYSQAGFYFGLENTARVGRETWLQEYGPPRAVVGGGTWRKYAGRFYEYAHVG